MRKLLLIVGLSLCGFVHTQILVFPYSQSFSSVVPSDFTSTSGGWNFVNNSSSDSRTGNYSSKLDPAINGNSKYIYIKISVKNGYTYNLSLYSRKVCTLRLNVNETSDQSTLLLPLSDISVSGCNGNGWRQSSLQYTSLYSGVMYFQILAYGISEDKVYIDDILITETVPVSLPISLLYFNVTSVGDYNRVSWSTTSEFNNDYFSLYKSIDGYYYTPVTNVSVGFNSTKQLYYEVCDYILYNGILYYRLNQFDIDGCETVFDIISVDNRLKVSPILLKVTNIMGQVVEDFKASGILLYHYDDGSVIKRYIE